MTKISKSIYDDGTESLKDGRKINRNISNCKITTIQEDIINFIKRIFKK